MTARRSIPASTIAAQCAASDPAASVWVSAHAGSGKTHVLTNRVVRLLLEGAPPSRILCLTYTKAAAANMSLRVFDTLARWTRLDDDALRKAVTATGAAWTPATAVAARRLFARTIETPGGLKIQTIHAFCERLLHVFPFEANVSPTFQLIEDAEKFDLIERAKRDTLAAAAAEPESALGHAVSIVSALISRASFDDLLREILGKKNALATILQPSGVSRNFVRDLRKKLGLAAGDTVAAINRAIAEDGIPFEQWAALATILSKGSVNDQKLSKACSAAILAEGEARVERWFEVFFTQAGKPRGDAKTKIITQTLQKLEPSLLAKLEAERDRLIGLLEKRKSAQIVEQTIALLEIADRILQKYAAAKNARALLDFDDLIGKTLNLLSRSDAGWILYKLDSGIDHILIDEAQDTSPQQWEILRTIADEFFSGKGQRQVTRTLFAVGDEKQSIYSFQGAEPRRFSEMRAHFSAKIEAASKKIFRELKLHWSFRSTPIVLEAVDTVFRNPAHRKGLTSDDDVELVHSAIKEGAPGLVELWETVAPNPADETRDWTLPLDRIDAKEPAAIVAKRISKMVAGWLRKDSPERVIDERTNGPRPIRAGDIMVLVRTRSAFFEAMIRAFKDAGVPVAGADRLRFAEHIAVMDLIAVGRIALLPQDDLSLACVVKSPLIGLDDDDLIELAPKRDGSLLAALSASGKPGHRAASQRIEEWRRLGRVSTPFAFYSRILGAEGGRRALIGRLGPDANDAIDEFLSQALKHEQDGVPSLVSFLAALEGSDSEVKRDMEAAGETVRIMTVHAAKGLESKIVILPDTCSVPSGRHDPKIFMLDGMPNAPVLAWSPRKDDDPAPVAAAREELRAAAQDEYRRLLYVAMTRAEERLYVMGYEGSRARPTDCWFNMIETALKSQMSETPAHWDAQNTVFRRVSGGFPDEADDDILETKPLPVAPLPVWLTTALAHETGAGAPLAPSLAVAPARQAFRAETPQEQGERNDPALLGQLMHLLLQHLPAALESQREALGEALLSRNCEAMSADAKRAMIGQALRVLAMRELQPIFAAGSRAEVAIAGRIALNRGESIEVAGQVDRMAFVGNELWIADFKTGARPRGGTPAQYTAQLALYHAVLNEIFPGKAVRPFLVWTSQPFVQEIGPDEIALAFAAIVRDHIGVNGSTPNLDGAGAAT